MNKGLGGLSFDLGPALAIENVGDQEVMIACTLKPCRPTQKPGAPLINGRGSRLATAGVTNTLEGAVGGFSKTGKEILAPIGENGNSEIGACFQKGTKAAPFRQSDT